MADSCQGDLHPQAVAGIRLFNARRFFEAHEALEIAWRDEKGAVHDLYRGILQAAVVYLHIMRGNYAGALKVYGRSRKWLEPWPDICRGVHVVLLRSDLDNVIAEVKRLGPDQINILDHSLFKPIVVNHDSA